MQDDPAAPLKPGSFTPHFAEPDTQLLPTPPRQGQRGLNESWTSDSMLVDSSSVFATGTTMQSEPWAAKGTVKSKRGSVGQAFSLTRSVSFLHGGRKVRWYHTCSQRLVNNPYFTALMTTLTVYALTGDDFRLLATDRPADIWFNFMTIVCLVCFSVELVASSIGKDDYFPGFFFCLDAVSTVTLVMDLTWVADLIMGDEDDFDKARSGRTARIGAKVGRIVRVIRLIRIVKLYKAWHESRKKKLPPQQTPGEEDEDSEWEEDDPNAAPEKTQRESLVGKKLSALTTQRVIILVLTMLLTLPLLRAEPMQQVPRSPSYGADDVWEAFHQYLNNKMPRIHYEKTLLKYMYYHNWFTGSHGCPNENKGCSNLYFSNAFWVGIASQDNAKLDKYAPLAQIRASTVAAWEANTSTQDDAYNYGTMPSEAKRILSSPWSTECTVNNLPFRGISLLGEEISDYNSFAAKCPTDLRVQERAKWNPRVLSYKEYKSWHLAFFFDLRPHVKAESGFSLGVTAFVCIVLCVASVFFSKDANALVLEPVEQMIQKVEAIRDNPLVAMKMADDEFRLEELKKVAQARERKEKVLQFVKQLVLCKSKHQEVMETVILDKTIIKLGTLLALGFGEAGANIVSHNMAGSNSAGVNAMIAGQRVDCILGNVRIRDFSVATEVLQGKVMTFVNQIAEIVHGVVNECAGAANKNNGETFMLVWRTEGFPADKVAREADMSMVAFAKVLGAVHRSRTLASYRGHPALKQRLGNGCRVNLSFGLHFGWAIEGAVGSEFKIDASYLSPNVSIAASVEHATSIYDISICATHAVVKLCTKEMAKKLRLIDRVIIKGSAQPVDLFSLDLDYRQLHVDEQKPRTFIWNLRQRYKARQMLEVEKNRKWLPGFLIRELFDDSPDVAAMRRKYSVEFLETFNMGYQNYNQGEWEVARRLLTHTQKMLGFRDGPSVALLRYMEANGFEAPERWQGVHHFGTQPDIYDDACGSRRGSAADSPKLPTQPSTLLAQPSTVLVGAGPDLPL